MASQRRAGAWQTWQEVQDHVASNELREGHTLEFKRDDYPSTEAGRKERAKDIAAMAIDGGTLIIGIDEDKSTGRATALTPVALQGLVERIDQICEGRISPPLAVSIRDHIRDRSDPTRGLIIIDVPATGIPHMVDHRYIGRSNRTTTYLEHPEVVRLLSRREADIETVEAYLTTAYEAMREQGFGPGCVVVVGLPVPILRPNALRDFLGEPGWKARMDAQITAAAQRVREFDATSPALAKLVDTAWSWFCDGANTRSPRRIPRGIAVPHSGPGGLAHTIEVYESGAIRVATDHVVWRSDTTEPTFNPRKAMSMAVQALALAAAIADLAGTRGSFGLGVLLGDMSGAYADPLDGWSASQGRIRDTRTPYRDTEYRQTTIATSIELGSDLTPIMDHLFGPLLRAIDLGDPLHTDRDT